jgi:lipopolysaccharide transport system ATP-binding protein
MKAIQFESVSKQYRLGEVGTGSLVHDLQRLGARFLGRPDPFSKVGDANDREAGGGQFAWALQEISFDIEEGDILGIIGRNGAGKSTLLKLLSRITAPTRGVIRARGRIASLLEVGTGFHPELTGRENIFLNGAILGMSRWEILRKLDQILEFIGCRKYIDTPVKRYSSGMSVRLGFAVAAHLDCEILVVDEVLAVGDAEFQRKCIGKMKEVSQAKGKTVLFVSHNISSIERLCNKGILLSKGRLAFSGTAMEVIRRYLDSAKADASQWALGSEDNRSGVGTARLRRVAALTDDGKEMQVFRCGEYVRLIFEIENCDSVDIDNVSVGYSISNSREDQLVVSYSDYENVMFTLSPGRNLVQARTRIIFPEDVYQLKFRLIANGLELDWPMYPIFEFRVEGGNFAGSGSVPHGGRGVVVNENYWDCVC